MMHYRALQKVFAYLALFLLPLPALNFGVSFTVGDVFLILAVLMNAGQLARLHSFQIAFLLALPPAVLSTLLDADASLTAALQVVYIWGFVLPFGWVAFVDHSPRQMAGVLLASVALSSLTAMGQTVGVLPQIGSQKLIYYPKGLNRGPGFSLQCNSLVMTLTPCYLLLPYVRPVSGRIFYLLTITGGMLAAMSKAIVLAVPGLLFSLARDPQKGKLATALLLAGTAGGVLLSYSGNFDDFWYKTNHSMDRRMSQMDSSVQTRVEGINSALRHLGECSLLGYGITGARLQIRQEAGYVVHLYYLGLVISAGLPAACLIFTGICLIIRDLWRLGETNMVAYLLSYLLGCTVMPVLFLTFQRLPFLLGAAVLASATQAKPAVRSKVKPGWMQGTSPVISAKSEA